MFPPCLHPSPWRLLAVGLTGAALLVSPVARAEKLDRAAQDWLKDVHLLILPQEEKTFRDLRDGADRTEFQAIFWARRDPDPGTPVNEFRNAWEKARVQADKLFAVPGERGSQTGCGQVFLLLGDPREAAGRKTEVYSTHFHDTKSGETHGLGETTYRGLKEGTRQPETWIYRSRPGDAFEFTGGELHIDMDEACRFPEGGHVLDELRRAAQARVVRSELDYQLGPDGHLVPLAALVAHVPAAPVLAEDKRDFPLAAEVKLLLRSQSGEPYVAGLLRGQPGSTAAPGAAPGGQARIRVVAQALEADGRVSATTDRLVSVQAGPDGSFVASFGLTLKPGHYTLRAGAFPSGDTRSAVVSAPLDVPDFGVRELTLGRLLLYTSADAPSTNPADPYGAFSVVRVRPRFGNGFARTDEIEAACVLYNAGIDPASGKAAVKVRFSFLKDGKPVARGQEETYGTKDAVASVGPVPLSGFAPGHYAVRIDVTDAVAGTTRTQEAPFEIRE